MEADMMLMAVMMLMADMRLTVGSFSYMWLLYGSLLIVFAIKDMFTVNIMY